MGTQALETFWPIVLGVAVQVVFLIVKINLYSDTAREDNRNRGGTYFHMSFFAPELSVLSISLMVSSQAIKSVLGSKSIQTKLGDNFYFWFFLLIIWQIIMLLISLRIWNHTDDRYRVFPVEEVRVTRSIRGGEETVVIYRIQLFRGLFSRIGFRTLLIGNLMGISSFAAYVVFVYNAFLG